MSERARMMTHLEEANTRLESLANLDALTGLSNRRHFERSAAEALCASRGASVSVLMLDIDNFKIVNDQHGHAAGDAVLRTIGALLRRGTRRSDVVGRLGGEEFGLVLSGTDEATGRSVAEKIRETIASLRFELSATDHRVTVTLGGTSHSGHVRDDAHAAELLSTLIARADEHLYIGKRTGRNRVVWG